MRLGVVLPWPVAQAVAVSDGGDARATADVVRLAVAAEAAALDLAWVAPPHPGAGGAPLAVAAALAPHTSAVAVGVTVEADDAHPLVVAEEIAVADQLLGGRLVVALRASRAEDADSAARYVEAVELILSCLAPRPFRHEGRFWRVPANLPENRFGVERAVRVTPPTAQIEPTVWCTGPHAEEVAARLGCAWLATADQPAGDAAATWGRLEERLGGVARRLRRPALRRVEPEPGDSASEALAADLSAEVHAWGLDCAVLDPGSSRQTDPQTDQLVRWVTMLGSVVRPRLQLDDLPPGLEEHWRGRRLAEATTP